MSRVTKLVIFTIMLISSSALPLPDDTELFWNGDFSKTLGTQSFVYAPSASRIVGGSVSAPGDFPYYVEIGFCGGALIAPDTVLTAAHCGNLRRFQLHIGAYNKSIIAEGSQERFCEEWVSDPLYDYYTAENDFALCKLNEPVYVNTSFVSLELNEDDAVPETGEDLIAMGLGVLSASGSGPDVVHNVTLPTVSNEDCKETYGSIITDNILCAGYYDVNKSVCFGDSGGPLVKRTYQDDGTFIDTHVGVVSFTSFNSPCDGVPGGFARTSKRASWIKSFMCDQFKSIAPFCSNTPEPSDPPCDQDLRIRVKTDDMPAASMGSFFSEKKDSRVLFLVYLLKDYQNEHKVCLELDACYEFTLLDLYEDGIENGGYELILNGEQIESGGGDFGREVTVEFCTDPSPSSSPSVLPTMPPSSSFAPTLEPCTDDPEFRFRNKEQKTCDYFLRSNKKGIIRRKCKKWWNGKKVKDWCSGTCGRKGRIGLCKDLFDQN